MREMSIRLRLTLLYSGILALMLIGLSAALYFTVARAFVMVAQDRSLKARRSPPRLWPDHMK
jgi:hypothetical protein